MGGVQGGAQPAVVRRRRVRSFSEASVLLPGSKNSHQNAKGTGNT